MGQQPSNEGDALRHQDQLDVQMKAQGKANPMSSVGPVFEESMPDGSQVIRFANPQPMDVLLDKAKERVEEGRFRGNGWVIGKGLAKISEDGKSVTYYPPEVADLVQDLVRGLGEP